jgi:hypothetical protein
VTNSGLPIGTANGQVEISAANATGYTLVGHSMSGNTFTYAKAGATTTKTCTGSGGCNGGSW